MKINEKHLISFATSNTTVDREGWLGKRGEVNKNLQKRWFVLKGNMLFYFEKKEDKEPVGVIILEGCSIELAENEETYAFNLVFHGSGNRTYVMVANTQKDMEEWMKAIASASYDYMKLMVSELQRQLDEITRLEHEAKISMQNRLRSGGLPMNLSDSCLSSRVEPSRPPRFNPFNTSVSNGDIKSMCGRSSDGQISAFSEDDLSRQNAHNAKMSRQKFLFLEMHEYYGQIFRRVYGEINKRHAAAATEPLISFD